MRETVERYFRAMQRGPEGEDELVALFADDAVYLEPFSDAAHTGREAIRDAALFVDWLGQARALEAT